MKIEVLNEDPWTPEELNAMIEEAHQAIAQGKTITMRNPHYTGPLLPPQLIGPVMDAAEQRNLTPDQILAEAVTAYLQPA